MSHVLEHIENFEDYIFKVLDKLNNGGILSIALPTDPGILWRLGRHYNRIFNIKKIQLNKRQYDYMHSTEHINSIFNLKNVIFYHFKDRLVESYEPFKIKSLDLNLFYILQIKK